MRFPLVIPPLLLLILNLPSLDSDADAFHNGSFDAVKSLLHIQFANISSIDGNFVTQNTRFRKSSTHDVKPLSLVNNDDNSEDTVPSQYTTKGSRGKRHKRDSQEDELAQAMKIVTDLMSEIRNITEKLKKLEEEASEANVKYEETKAAVDEKEKVAADWEDAEKARLKSESADEDLTNANTALDKATQKLKDANETLDAAEKELERVKGEPARLDEATTEFQKLDPEHTALQTAVNELKKKLPILQKAMTDAETEVSTYEAEVFRQGCKGKESKDPCERMRQVLEKMINDRNSAQKAYGVALADNKTKTERLAVCEPEWNRLKAKITRLKAYVAKERHETRMRTAELDVQTASETQALLLEEFKNALKTRDEAAETTRLAKESYDDKASKVPADGAEVGNAFQAAKFKFNAANLTKEMVDEDVNTLKAQLEKKNIELAQANAKVDALKQSKTEDKPPTGAAMYIGIGAGCGIILIILIIGSILFAVKQRKSKVKEEPSPTINPNALKYEKVPSLDKSKQESASMSSSNQRATPAKSDTNIATTQSNTNHKGGTALKRGELLTDIPPTPNRMVQVYKGPNISFAPRPMPAPLTTHETIRGTEIEYIENGRPLINAIAKPTNSSKKPKSNKLPSELKWPGPIKAIAMLFGDEKLETLPDALLHNEQDEEAIDKESENTQYDHTAPEPADKRTGAELLNEHAKDKMSVDDALKMATWIFIGFHRKLNFTFLALVQLAAAARDVFMKEKPLVECGLPVTIFGDIHGQVGDAVRLINIAAWDPANPNSRELDLNKQHFVFCGDYVDRGNRQVETLVLMFSLKITYPNNVHILRGNHETRDINCKYGFDTELHGRYDEDQAKKLYDVFNEVFDHLPLACLIGGKVLCVHGGISTHLHTLEDINKIPKPLSNINVSPLAQDLLWADPINGLSGTKPNDGRGISIHFGEDALDEKMTELELIAVIRGHQIPGNGYAWFGLKGHLCTVFSASDAGKKENYAAAIRIDEQGVKKMLIMYKGRRFPGDTQGTTVLSTDHLYNNEHEDVYGVFKEEEMGPCEMDQTRRW